MPEDLFQDQQFLEKQYRDASKLNARISLHQRFSVNPYGFHHWIFDQFKLPAKARILELGCGPGNLWSINLARIPSGWDVILSDFSDGMLQQAQHNLQTLSPFHYQLIDANSLPLPFADGDFEAVIANHMLYYIEDKPGLLADIRRILKPDGYLYASTIGENHLLEISAMVTRFDPEMAFWQTPSGSFTLENGAAQLAPWFEEVNLVRYEDALEVNDAEALSAYILSGWVELSPDKLRQFKAFIENEVRSHGGVLHITKDSGIFISCRK
jgi:SAM-dependent methyltransferase